METLDKHFRDLTRAAFARHGFLHGEVAARWPEIVGEALGRVSAPERIKWPRAAAETGRHSGGTLTVRAAPGRALDLQYAIPQIVERVNRFYGHGAIGAVKIVQAATWPGNPPPASAAAAPETAVPGLAAIADDHLRQALERLGRGVAGSARGSPQGK